MGTIRLIRHAQASFGQDDYDQLSALGFRQSERLASAYPHDPAANCRFITGTLKRHRQTMDMILTTSAAEQQPSCDKGWDEFEYLDVIGALRPDLRGPGALRLWLQTQDEPRRAFEQLYVTAVERWLSGAHDADYRESRPAFCARVNAALARAIQDSPRNGLTVIVTSAGAIGAVIQTILGLPGQILSRFEQTLVNTGVTALTTSRSGARILSLNCHSHLLSAEPGLVTFR